MSFVHIPCSVNSFVDMRPTITLSPLGLPFIRNLIRSILNHLMRSRDVDCILMFLSAMPIGVSVAHIYVRILALNGRQFSIINDNNLD